MSLLPKAEEKLHDNHPCCGCGPHCLVECPNFYSFDHPQYSNSAYCSHAQKDLNWYDGAFQAACHNGYTQDELDLFYKNDEA